MTLADKFPNGAWLRAQMSLWIAPPIRWSRSRACRERPWRKRWAVRLQKGMSVGQWQLVTTLSDGSRHCVWVQIK